MRLKEGLLTLPPPLQNMTTVKFEAFVVTDEDLETRGVLSDVELLETVRGRKGAVAESQLDPEEDPPSKRCRCWIDCEKLSKKKALRMLVIGHHIYCASN